MNENFKSQSAFVVFTAGLMTAGLVLMFRESRAAEAKAGAGASAAEAEKAKAASNPYANDLGPDKIDVSGYLKQYQEGYAVLQTKCAKSHTSARPIGSQFVEPVGKNVEERKAKAEAFKKSDPDMFKDKNIWQVEGDIWQRYVKRMMSKPGCDITKDEGKKVWEFLAYDSVRRKTGPNKAQWRNQRQAFLEQFKAKFSARYKELYEASAIK